MIVLASNYAVDGFYHIPAPQLLCLRLFPAADAVGFDRGPLRARVSSRLLLLRVHGTPPLLGSGCVLKRGKWW